MMRKEKLHILSSKQVALDTVEMVLENTYISKTAVPGQFLHVSVEGHSLRRPISIADIDMENETITILFKIIGSGTKQLATYQRGMKIDVLGPSGNGFNLEIRADSTILLIGGGIGVPPLYYLGKTLAKNHIKLISILGYQTAQHVFYEQRFQEIGETHIVTNDGTHGKKGLVTDVLDTFDFDRYYACGPVPMLQAITAKLEHQPGFISLEERMGCGVGACFACVIPTDTPDGYKKICKDGPVFNAQEVSL
ncbi:dihydroorotate dehydrogenase electron transfer subunit [Virgibacillus natechei]|uniref:Dihydroorotate dehydrogenase B (NAD(+)), electron transfer subunit n=1 Tax=Virgibacillus natechei TaxID=1216297 RepID=A0ABS4IB67_9BACI|nr:dihydroorotate dehydrogenase electron transfer subunit [Virgibacillus natechei]MBP1968170.1 dihydroorotate dehydrogenase electron transfer subunit [Virgibacillus natechei]UZD14555.1 dihydroorotate dehydrogenase electron transfer subunit [Virgibacillus natechei]